MTRNEKIHKLANAVKDFRGRYWVDAAGKRGKWDRPPQPAAMERVKVWLRRIGLPVDETLHQIRSFKSYQEFNEWIRTL